MGTRPWPCPCTQTSSRLLARAAPHLRRTAGSLEPEDLCRAAWAYARLRHPDDDLFEALATAALDQISSYSRGQVTRLAGAFKQLGYADSDYLLEAWQGGSDGDGDGDGRSSSGRWR